MDDQHQQQHHGATASLAASSPLYESKTLLCKNNCGYYGNPIQYEGYCSICYRRLKQYQQHQQQQQQRNYVSSSASFDDSTSLLTSSLSFNNGFNVDDTSKKYINIHPIRSFFIILFSLMIQYYKDF